MREELEEQDPQIREQGKKRELEQAREQAREIVREAR